MPYVPRQAQPSLDVEGLRKYSEEEYREIARAWEELLTKTQQTLTDAQIEQVWENLGLTTVALKNYILNGTMRISQEFGTTAITGGYAADQWFCTASTTGTINFQQVASVTPAGSPNRLRVTVLVADTTIAAGEYCAVLHYIEGNQIADLRSGSASAKTITVRFGCKGPAGTYCVVLRNGVADRHYVTNVVISAGEANTDVVKSFTIPLDQSGTWYTDHQLGFNLTWMLSCGSTFHTAHATWSAGNLLATSSISNFMNSTSNVFELFDVGLYMGVAPPTYEIPNYADELIRCRRYWWCSNPTSPKGVANGTLTGYSLVANYIGLASWRFTVPMRSTPAITIWQNGTQNNVRNTATGAITSIGSVVASNLVAEGGNALAVTSTAAGVWLDFDMQANARM